MFWPFKENEKSENIRHRHVYGNFKVMNVVFTRDEKTS